MSTHLDQGWPKTRKPGLQLHPHLGRAGKAGHKHIGLSGMIWQVLKEARS